MERREDGHRECSTVKRKLLQDIFKAGATNAQVQIINTYSSTQGDSQDELSLPFSLEEIRQTFFQMHPLKASGTGR